ncbi:MAG: tetratricopeptide repeat protein, partial [Stellaceae bacterium]
MQRTLIAGGAAVLLASAGTARGADLSADAALVPPATSPTDHQAAALASTGGGETLRLLADRWVRSLPRSANAWFYHGLVAEMNGSKSWAIDDYRRALELAPGLGAAAYALGRTLASMDKYNAAIEPLRLASASYPQNSRIWADYGVVLGALGRYQDAANALQRSVRLDPGNGTHAGELADLYAALKDYAHAVPLYRQASRKAPADAANFAWLGNLGQVYELMGDYRQSIVTVQQALRYAPND